MLKRLVRIGLLVAAALSAPTQSSASTVLLNASFRGWYESDGDANGASAINNYVVGDCRVPGAPGGGCASNDYRDWFKFDLSGVTETVVSAMLFLDNPITGFTSPDTTETYVLFDVAAGNLGTLGSSSAAIWTDLGSGTSYGSFVATTAANGTTVSIALNPSALAAINAALGSTFSIGGALTTLNGIADAELLFGGTGGAGTRTRLQLTTEVTVVPEPTTILMVGSGIGSLIVSRRRPDPTQRRARNTRAQC